jgi:tRNA(Ile)-lysidine synthase
MNWKSHQAALDKSLLKKPLCLRKYEKGDYFYPSGMNGKKLLSKFFKDEKFTTLQKESQWLLCSGEDIVWLVGKRCDNRFTAKVSTGEILLIQLEQ